MIVAGRHVGCYELFGTSRIRSNQGPERARRGRTVSRERHSRVPTADLCALDPERATRVLVDREFTQKPEFTRQMLVDVPYRRWREYNPEDAVRLYALRLQEAGMIRSSPQKILAQGTDWRFFHELKRELKG